MIKSPMADRLTQRIALYKRVRGATEEGDPTVSWSLVGRVWAHVRVKQDSSSATIPGEERQRVEVSMRSTRYRFQGMEWGGRLYQRQGRGIEDAGCMTWWGKESSEKNN
jgi:head-tail adaptor